MAKENFVAAAEEASMAENGEGVISMKMAK
jgi:hypothetical protein